MFVNKHFAYLGMHISDSKRCYNVILSIHYFYVKRRILAGFKIRISAPLIELRDPCERIISKH